MKGPLPGGSTLGLLGGGQLGRMFVEAAHTLGYRVVVLSPDAGCPAAQVADAHICRDFTHREGLAELARRCEVVTLEFENVPVSALEFLGQHVAVYPGPAVLETCQNRLREKRFLARFGFETAPWRPIVSWEDLESAAKLLGYPTILKSAGWGYDGKGQVRINHPEELGAAWERVGGPAVLEGFVPFERELSMMAARSPRGELRTWGLMENRHVRHILDLTLAPAQVSPSLLEEASLITQSIMETLDVVGVLCVEFFLTRDGRLLVNELAPRPHNSGHLTIEAAPTSQFEQQVRAVVGLPLGETRPVQPSAMANLLGDLWEGGEPHWDQLETHPEVKLHLYGKSRAAPGRKMGHLTSLASSPGEAAEKVLAAREALRRDIPHSSMT